jgi:hypothetical protein
MFLTLTFFDNLNLNQKTLKLLEMVNLNVKFQGQLRSKKAEY